MHINLFSEAFQRRMLLSRRARRWVKVWCISFSAALVLSLVRWPENLALRSELAIAQLQATPVAATIAECEQLKAELSALAEARKKLQILAPDSAPLGVLGLIAAAVEQANKDIQIRSIKYTARRDPLQRTNGAAPAEGGSLVIHGLAANEGVAAEFVESLRRSSSFHQVELKASSRATTTTPAIQFDVVCHL